MEDIKQFKNNIKKYIINSKKFNIDIKNIEIELKQLGGFSNKNYRGIIKDISKNEIIEEVFYRQFEAKFPVLSESVDHENESKITEKLGEKGYGPKLLYAGNDFSITEFQVETIDLPFEKCFDQKIIEQLCTILNFFTSISYTYKYKINHNNITFTPIEEDNKEKISISKNIFDACMVKIFENTKTSYKTFSDKFKEKYTEENHQKEWNDVKLIQNYIDNYKDIFIKNFPSQGFLVLNHNDAFRFNILFRQKDQKIFLIDHEYFNLNLPGFDIAYFMTEYYVKFEPEYSLDLDKVNFDKSYEVYKQFINIFIQEHKFIEKEEGGKDFIEMIKTKKYFLQLINLVNLYLFIWSAGNSNFEKWDKNYKDEFFFIHAYDRIKFYLITMKEFEKIDSR